jgi:hypothetical protein
MKKFLAACAALAALVLVTVPTALANPDKQADGATLIDGLKYCPSGQLVVDVTQTVVNDADAGVLGNAWAVDQYTRQIQVLKTGPNSYCAGTRYTGSFTSNDGPSPGGTAAVTAGITGSIGGGYRSTNFKAHFAPTVPTSGPIGVFDYRCDAAFNCPGYVNWTSLFFKNVQSFGLARWEWVYTSAANGSWYNSYLGNFGDIRQ